MQRWTLTLLAATAAALTTLAALPARADHEPADTILNQFRVLAPRLHGLQPASSPRELPQRPDGTARQRLTGDLQALVRDNFAVVVLERGELVAEAYGNGASAERPLNAYSMTKSLTALAVGEALCAGKIASLDDTAARYVPALEGTAYGRATLRQLLSYTSGAKDPGGTGYSGVHNGRDWRDVMTHQMSLLDLARRHGEPGRFQPGQKFIYNGLDSETLSLVLRAATGQSLPQWFEATVWQKAGAQYPAGWYLDRDGNGVAEMLMLAAPRDFARLGLYVLERLTGQSPDACMNRYIQQAAQPLVAKGYWDAAPQFGLGLHVGADGNTWFFGHGGQRVGVNTRNQRVIATNGWRDTRSLDPTVQRLLTAP